MSGKDGLHGVANWATQGQPPDSSAKSDTMLLSVPVSVGEVVDKLTILEIKSARISDPDKLQNIAAELDALRPLVSGGVFDGEEVALLTDALRTVNGQLWDIEDNIRAEEAAGRFGDRFIELARAVYVTNDRRAELKKKINLATGSALVEEKSYEDYAGKG
jgi:hypothetical protein